MAVTVTHQHPRLPEPEISAGMGALHRERFTFTKLAADTPVACVLQHIKTAKQVLVGGAAVSWSQAGATVSVVVPNQQTNGDIIIIGKAAGMG